ncbi:sensor histidine kinase [Actinophytocola oryzae]|uniref:histidine kinase n=1 Tax=Actinophytocola oryzae TaxID=502181 RepID=A0A4R7W6L1_9PSEU|nr:sensor histidine kinase [Actinophytocola oryzae]TDV57935.1 signal transduction histidine kinase [Actinophytocola oryzae]
MTAGRPRSGAARAITADVALAASAAALDLFLFSTITGNTTPAADKWLAVAFALCGFVALLVRRRYPVAVFGVVWAGALVALAMNGLVYGPILLPCVALFTVALTSRGRVSASALFACAVLGLVSSLQEAGSKPPEKQTLVFFGIYAFHLLLYASSWAVGRWMRLSRKHAVLSERTRIARELHDIVAHSVTVMMLQAAGAHRVLDTDPARARQALGHIEQAGEQAMGELRRMLTALRGGTHDQDPTPNAVASEPQPGLAHLPHLIDTIRATGVHVRTRVDGEPATVAASVELAVYRIVQEALTNVTKHVGPGADVEVALVWAPDVLTVTVTDDGQGDTPARSPLSTHNGLPGLRERLDIVGGRLDAGALPGGGFRLTAELPVTEPDPLLTPALHADAAEPR